MLPYSLSLSPSLFGSFTKNSGQRKRRGERRTNTGGLVSPIMGRGEKLIKEVAKDACVRLDSIGIDNDDKVSTVESKEGSSKARDIAIGNKEACIEVVSSCVTSLDIRKGVDDSTGAGRMVGSRSFYPIDVNHACIMTNIVVSPASFGHTWEGEAQLILKIFAEVQGADLRRFNKHKKRVTLWTDGGTIQVGEPQAPTYGKR